MELDWNRHSHTYTEYRAVYAIGQSNAGIQILTLHISVTAELIMIKNLKLRTTTWIPHTIQNCISIRRRGWSGQIPRLPLFGFFVFFWFLSRAHRSHQWTDFDDLYVIQRVSMQGCAFWGLHWYSSQFRGSPPQNTNFWGISRHFPAKPAKYWNFYMIKTMKCIPTKFGRW